MTLARTCPTDTGFGLDQPALRRLLDAAAAPRAPASRSATTCSTSPRAAPATPVARHRLAQRVHGARPGARGRERARAGHRLAHRRPAPRPASSRTWCRWPTVTLHLPFEVADYVDFYSSEHHAANVGRIFRPGLAAADAELEAPADRLPRPRRHGRGVRARRCVRPCGPAHGAGRRAPDVRPEPPAGHRGGGRASSSARRRRWATPVPVGAFAEHVVRRLPGQRLVGPRPAGLGVRAARARSSASRSSPRSRRGWCRSPRSRRRACRRRRATPSRCPTCATTTSRGALDITLEVRLERAAGQPAAVRRTCTGPRAQQLAHLTVNGASLRTGDLFASGTVSGPERDQRGSLLELSWGGTEPLRAGRRLDADVPRGRRRGDDHRHGARDRTARRIGFGEVTGRVEPARG